MSTSSFQTTSTSTATTTSQSSAINSTTSGQEAFTEPKNLALKTDSSSLSSNIVSSTTSIASQATSSDPSSTTSLGSSRNEFTTSSVDLDLEQRQDQSTATTSTTSVPASVSVIENTDEAAALPVVPSSASVLSSPQISRIATATKTSKNSFSTVSPVQHPPPASIVIDTTTSRTSTTSMTTAHSIVIDTTTSSSTTSTSTLPSFVINTTTSSATTLTTASQQAAPPSELFTPPPPATHPSVENNNSLSNSGNENQPDVSSAQQQQPIQLQVDVATSETAVHTTSTTNAIDPADAAATGISDTYVAPIVAHGGLNSLGEERTNGSGGRANTDVITSNPVIIPGASKLALGALTLSSSSSAAEGSANSFLAVKGIPTFVIILMFGVFLVCMTVAVFFGVRWHMGGRHGKEDGKGKDIVDLEGQLHTRTARKTISFRFENDDEPKIADCFSDLQWKIQLQEDAFLWHSSDSSETASTPVDGSEYSDNYESFNGANEEVAGITMMRNSVFSHASDSTDASLPPMPKFKSLALSDISIP